MYTEGFLDAVDAKTISANNRAQCDRQYEAQHRLKANERLRMRAVWSKPPTMRRRRASLCLSPCVQRRPAPPEDADVSEVYSSDAAFCQS